MKIVSKTLAGLFVALAASIPAHSDPITFQVDLSAQTALGNFNPSTDTVNVAGDGINSWNTTASQLNPGTPNTNIYVGTFDVAGNPGATIQFKYLLNTAANGTVWEGNVGTTGGTGNRTFILSGNPQTLPVVFFNNVTNSVNYTNNITFQVDMSVQIAQGNFDPSSGTVNLAGEFNGWNSTATPMTNSPTDTNIWVMTIPLSGAPGTSIGYKFIMNGTWEGNVGPNGSQNRALVLQTTNQVLPAVYFNNQSSAPVSIPIEFQVDLAVQIALGNFNPTTDYVEARGSFNNDWAGGFSLTNSPAAPNIYTGVFVDTGDVIGTAMSFKFVLNGSTWESINNRSFTLASTNQQTVPVLFFNDVNNLGPITVQTNTPGQAVLSWTGGPGVRLQSSTNLVHPTWQDIPNTAGTNTATIPVGSSQLYFQLNGP
jgi:hypothetical protein